MMKRDRSQKASSKAASIAAPVGGWNARDSLADMAIHDAVSMENWQPLTTTAVVREGYSIPFAGSGSQIETLMSYQGGAASTLFAVNSGGELFNVSAGQGPAYLLLGGIAGDYLSTPDSTALDITDSIDIRACIAPDDWTPTSVQTITGKWEASGQFSYLFLLRTNGQLRFLGSNSGTATQAANSSVSTGFAGGSLHWVRVTCSPAANEAIFYTSEDGEVWAQLGTTQTIVLTLLNNSTSPLEIGANQLGTSDPFAGKIYTVQIYNGINGTLAAEFSGALTSAQTGEAYTLHGDAALITDPELDGLTNGRFQHVNFTTSGGNYLVMCNGADDVYNYDGTTWTNPAITGVTSSTLNTVNIHKSRLWFTQTGTLKAWYLPTQSIAGAANALDLSAYCPHGGYLMAMGTWTMDAGYGVDDMAAFVTNQGDCLVYRGTDPSSATTWALVGVWWIGQPIGRRCFVKYKGDMLIICEDGLFSLANALQSSRVDPKLALTDKIQQTMQESVALYRNNFGWQVIPFDGKSILIMNVPTQEGQYQEQYVMNTITGAWCKFTGWDANCWELFNDSIYFGGNGFVGRAFHTNADNGTAIVATCQQAFNYFKTPGQSKRFAMMRPTLMTNGSPSIQGAINVDFDLSPPSSNLSTLTITGATWDSAVWDTGLWQNTLITSRNWQGATGIGYAGGVRLDSSTNGIQLQWVATDVVMESGGII